MPRRNRRGLNLIFVSVLMSAVVLSLNVYVQQMVRTERIIRAGEIATHLTNLATDLDFWVHYNRDEIDHLIQTIPASRMFHRLHAAEIATPFLSHNRNNWDIIYVILKIEDEPHPFGVVVAEPTSPTSQSLSSLVQKKINQYKSSSQTGAPYSLSYLRGLLEILGIADHDVAFFSYNFNGLNTDYVLRQQFAGIPTTVMATDVAFTNTSIHPEGKYSVNNIKDVAAKKAEIIKIISPVPSVDSEDSFYAGGIAATALNVPDLSVLGHVSGQNMTASILNAEDLKVSGETSAPTLTVSQPSTFNGVTVRNRFKATGNADIAGIVTVQNNIELTGVIAVRDSVTVREITSENRLTITTAKPKLLSSNGTTVTGRLITESCAGC